MNMKFRKERLRTLRGLKNQDSNIDKINLHFLRMFLDFLRIS